MCEGIDCCGTIPIMVLEVAVKPFREFLMVVVWVIAFTCSSHAQPTIILPPDDPQTIVLAFVSDLIRGSFDEAAERFDPIMARAMPPPALEKFWSKILTQNGPFQARGDTRVEKTQDLEVVVIGCRFALSSMALKFSVGRHGKISGMFVVPIEESCSYTPPPHISPSSYRETSVTVGAKGWPLPGTLTLPVGSGPFPAVVLVHGSGPNDRDETIGPNKPFKDVALGLSSRGIAVLRYDKRTRTHRSRIGRIVGKLTVDEEVIDDAVAAIQFLKTWSEISSKRIFLLGHSLGGYLAPRIAFRVPDLAGVIVFAGAARPIEDAIVEQTRYILSLNGPVNNGGMRQLEVLSRQAARVKDPALSSLVPSSELPFGLPAAYWLSMRGYDPPVEARRLGQPILVLQGERDYQVTMAEFSRWKEALAGKMGVSFRSYPQLNHLFIEGEGRPVPAEYERPGHVSNEVVKDLALWIKNR